MADEEREKKYGEFLGIAEEFDDEGLLEIDLEEYSIALNPEQVEGVIDLLSKALADYKDGIVWH